MYANRQFFPTKKTHQKPVIKLLLLFFKVCSEAVFPMLWRKALSCSSEAIDLDLWIRLLLILVAIWKYCYLIYIQNNPDRDFKLSSIPNVAEIGWFVNL